MNMEPLTHVVSTIRDFRVRKRDKEKAILCYSNIFFLSHAKKPSVEKINLNFEVFIDYLPKNRLV